MNLYEATIQDAAGKDFNARLRTASDADAKTVANAIAGQSDGKWTGLFKISQVTLPSMQDLGAGSMDVTPNYLQAPDAASDIQKKGRLIYATAVQSNYIPVEIPSVKPAFLTKNTTTQPADPLDSTHLAFLVSENSAAAVLMKTAKYHLRNRRK